MTWLKPLTTPDAAGRVYEAYFADLDARLSDPATHRPELVRELLAELVYGRSYTALQADSPLLALNLERSRGDRAEAGVGTKIFFDKRWKGARRVLR